jgi:myb proto-oncogene protein
MLNQLSNSIDNFSQLSDKEKNISLFKITKIEKSNQNIIHKNAQIPGTNEGNEQNKKFMVEKDQILPDKKENPVIIQEKEGKPIPWTEEDDKLLLITAKQNNERNWRKIASSFRGRTSIQCSSRYHRIKPGLTKGHFTREEDLKLISLYKIYGKKWNLISKEMKNRTGKQVRDRFLNSLAPGVNKKRFTFEEDKKIIKYYKIYGKSWSLIAKHITGRTGDMIKNRFYSNLCKIYKKEKLQKDEIIEEEKTDNQNSESEKNESFQEEKNNIIIDLHQNNTPPNDDNINQKFPFSNTNNINIPNNINNNQNININNNFFFMNNVFNPFLIPNLLFPNLTKENRINQNNFGLNIDYQNCQNRIFGNNEFNNLYNLKYNPNINNKIEVLKNIDNNKNIPYSLNQKWNTFNNINNENKAFINPMNFLQFNPSLPLFNKGMALSI